MKRTKINNILLIVFTMLMTFHVLSAQIVSPFNKLSINDSGGNYSFIVSGHFHGASTNASTFPASTLLANIDTLNSLKSSFLMSLGDMFIDVNETYYNHYHKSLFDKLKMPLFNAVGNHDVSNGNMYESFFGKEYFSFQKEQEAYIILNTESNDGSIKGEQLVFLTEALKKSDSLKNIFIFSHRPVWTESNARYKKLFIGNTRTQLGQNNFETVIRPLLLKYAKQKQIYWMSGSMGGGSSSFFYDKEPVSNITFIQTAIRNEERDAVLIVNINNGNVSFNGLSLTGQKLDKIENYGINYWMHTTPVNEKINFRLLPYLIFQMVMHHYFWIGLLSGVLLMLLGVAIWKRKRKNS